MQCSFIHFVACFAMVQNIPEDLGTDNLANSCVHFQMDWGMDKFGSKSACALIPAEVHMNVVHVRKTWKSACHLKENLDDTSLCCRNRLTEMVTLAAAAEQS